MNKLAIALIAALVFFATPISAKDKPEQTKLGDLDCETNQIAKYDGAAWVCSEDVAQASELVIVDANGQTVGSPAWIDGGNAYLLLDFEGSYLSLPVNDQGFAFDYFPPLVKNYFLFENENCSGQAYTYGFASRRAGLTIAALGAPFGEILVAPEEATTMTIDVISGWDPRFDPPCQLVAIEADIAAVFSLSTQGTPLDQCHTDDAGLDNSEPFGTTMFITPRSSQYPAPDPQFETQELINIGGGTLQASFVAPNSADFSFTVGNGNTLQCVNPVLDGSVTDVIDYNVACNYDEQFDVGSPNFWVQATANEEPTCYVFTIQPIYSQLLVPRRTKYAVPTEGTGLVVPELAPPLTLEKRGGN